MNAYAKLMRSLRGVRLSMAENLDVFDFELTSDDKEAIAGLDADHSGCYDHTDLTVVGGLLGFIKSAI